ncbi:LysM peptidoglycan-binding domain-containing protein [Streptomyces althioticus]|uniref:LysM peptidoglycan-binding domain-containing protein n=1 Tax=Streptomyces althioticus TaxID=83380 RepID=UPI0033D9D21B
MQRAPLGHVRRPHHRRAIFVRPRHLARLRRHRVRPDGDRTGKAQQIEKAGQEPAAPQGSAAQAASGHRSARTDRGASRGACTVRPGDTLSGMPARRGADRKRLCAANRDVIGDDPDVIVPGQRLDI